MQDNIQNHHILWQRSEWKYGVLHKIRRTPELIVGLPHTIHKELHAECKPVFPIQDLEIANIVKRDILPQILDYGAVERLKWLVDGLVSINQHDTAKGIGQQIPFIEQFRGKW